MADAKQMARLLAAVPAARASMRQFGVPASVTLAQWILESNYGDSQLARRALNCFGIKAAQGQTYLEFSTREVVQGRSTEELAKFAKYASIEEGFAAHARLLSRCDRYSRAMAALPDVDQFCVLLQICGYSTAPDYAAKLANLIAEHKLTQYDAPEPPPTPPATRAA